MLRTASRSLLLSLRPVLVPVRASPTITQLARTINTKPEMSAYTVVSTEDAPAAIGPYSQCVKYNGVIYSSGCIPLSASTMEIVGTTIEEQSEQVFKNVAAVLKAAGSDTAGVMKTTVFLKSMNDFAPFNKLYEAFFAPHKPARSCVEVARLPKDVLVEVEFIAIEKK